MDKLIINGIDFDERLEKVRLVLHHRIDLVATRWSVKDHIDFFFQTGHLLWSNRNMEVTKK